MANSSSSGNILPLIGRILIAVIPMVSGLFKLAGYSQIVGFAAAKGLPMPNVAIACAAAVELLGGLAILLGFKARVAAWVLFLYLIPVTLVFHNFWKMQGMEQQDNMIHFLKNLAIMGGLLLLAANGPGAYSVDERAAKA
jgi:putative oxidoreductase